VSRTDGGSDGLRSLRLLKLPCFDPRRDEIAEPSPDKRLLSDCGGPLLHVDDDANRSSRDLLGPARFNVANSCSDKEHETERIPPSATRGQKKKPRRSGARSRGPEVEATGPVHQKGRAPKGASPQATASRRRVRFRFPKGGFRKQKAPHEAGQSYPLWKWDTYGGKWPTRMLPRPSRGVHRNEKLRRERG
jgi:hypothetical protein